MKIKYLILILASTACSFQALAWGQTGHRVSGAIAEHYLKPEVQLLINEILVNEDLAEISTYPDEMRSNPNPLWQTFANPWHYVDVHEGQSYIYSAAPPQGDAVTALALLTEQLKSEQTSQIGKKVALSFIVHIIGDLHQPFHSGTNLDKGGNDIKLTFFNKDSNLHRVWDSGLIDSQRLSYSEWTTRLQRKITAEQEEAWAEVDPVVWIDESVQLRLKSYPIDSDLSWDYQYQHLPNINLRLKMSGVRIAAYLNGVFSDVNEVE